MPKVRAKMMARKMAFQVMGWLLLAYAAGMVVLSVASVERYPPPPRSGLAFARFGLIVLALVIVAFGLLHLRKWAALAFSILTLCVAFFAAKASIHFVPWSWPGIGYWFAILLIMPSIVTVKYWGVLVWHRRAETPESTSRLSDPQR